MRCAKIFAADQCPPVPAPVWKGERYRHDRIRLAYASADFRNHSVAYLMAELFERHDRGRFETIALSCGRDEQSPMRTRLKGAFDKFIDVHHQSDRDIALLIRELEIDIAVDLMSFTQNT